MAFNRVVGDKIHWCWNNDPLPCSVFVEKIPRDRPNLNTLISALLSEQTAIWCFNNCVCSAEQIRMYSGSRQSTFSFLVRWYETVGENLGFQWIFRVFCTGGMQSYPYCAEENNKEFKRQKRQNGSVTKSKSKTSFEVWIDLFRTNIYFAILVEIKCNCNT